MGDKRKKLTDFKKKARVFFNLFISAILGWPSLLLFDGPNELDSEPSYG